MMVQKVTPLKQMLFWVSVLVFGGVGRLVSFGDSAHVQGRTVSFREGNMFFWSSCPLFRGM